MILDATIVPQAIRFPTDPDLLNEAREFSEQIIALLYANTDLKKKPRPCRGFFIGSQTGEPVIIILLPDED